MAAGDAFWTKSDVETLLDYLLEVPPEGGTSGNFKSWVWTDASNKLTPLVTQGGPKMAASCKYKWGNVCVWFFIHFSILTWISQLKKTFSVVKAIQAVSGWTWSDETGASIDDTTADTWDSYVAKHKDTKLFHNAGWAHLEKVMHLMPSAAHGQNVFWPSEGSTAPDAPKARSQVDESTQGTQSPSQEDVDGSADAPRGENLDDADGEGHALVHLLFILEN